MQNQIRGKNVAIGGAVIQTVFCAVLLGVWLWTDSVSVMMTALFAAAGVPVWIMASLAFYCRQLQRREELELAQIAADSGRIFNAQIEGQVAPAAARLAWLERWVTPIFTLAWAVAQAVVAVLLLRYIGSRGEYEIGDAAPGALVLLPVTFMAFLFSRYAGGLARVPQWRPLMATSSYMLVGVVGTCGAIGCLLAAWQGYTPADRWFAYVLPVLQLLLAAELALNFLLSIYRPHIAGEEAHPTFESRLFGLVAEPTKVGHSIAEALNYQFGFEVSGTWFYQLLSRSIIPLTAAGIAVLLVISSVVITQDGHKQVVLRFGAFSRVLEPGLSAKWPWPIETTRDFSVGGLDEALLGLGKGQEGGSERRLVNGHEMFLWNQDHGMWTADRGNAEELSFVIAAPRAANAPVAGAGTINLAKLVVQVLYNVTDVRKFGYNYNDGARLVECVAYQQLVRYCSTATLDGVGGGGGLMTGARDKVAKDLTEQIGNAIKELDLGIEVKRVAILAAHPPSDAAPIFQQVLEAQLGQQKSRYEAQAYANRILSSVAGDSISALRLALAIQKLQALEDLQSMQRSPSEFNRRLEEFTTRAKADLDEVEQDIHYQESLGKLARTTADTTKTTTTATAATATANTPKLNDNDNRLGVARTETANTEPLRVLAGEHAQYLQLLQRIAQAVKDGGQYNFADDLAAARLRADTLFNKAEGEPASLIAKASAERWTREMAERSRAESFSREMMAYDASPRIYMLDRWLDVWDEVLPNVPKYVLGVDRQRLELWINWEKQQDPGQVLFNNPAKDNK